MDSFKNNNYGARVKSTEEERGPTLGDKVAMSSLLTLMIVELASKLHKMMKTKKKEAS